MGSIGFFSVQIPASVTFWLAAGFHRKRGVVEVYVNWFGQPVRKKKKKKKEKQKEKKRARYIYKIIIIIKLMMPPLKLAHMKQIVLMQIQKIK